MTTNEELIEEARNHVEHYPITEGDAARVARLADALEVATKPRTVEWGVQYGAGNVNQFEDAAAGQRFIDHPPMWFTGPTDELVIVSRLAATDWEPFTPADAGSET